MTRSFGVNLGHFCIVRSLGVGIEGSCRGVIVEGFLGYGEAILDWTGEFVGERLITNNPLLVFSKVVNILFNSLN